ncbi:dnaJ homolog subfamily C member 4 isoform X2 [Pelodiscus sinensis]|uniref:dnaJ homolog subfamily C member 4 isoform X2 n=1 Tax=Pelodiscus sinensis TaxID=13735 RepID=UPI003F6AD0BF
MMDRPQCPSSQPPPRPSPAAEPPAQLGQIPGVLAPSALPERGQTLAPRPSLFRASCWGPLPTSPPPLLGRPVAVAGAGPDRRPASCSPAGGAKRLSCCRRRPENGGRGPEYLNFFQLSAWCSRALKMPLSIPHLICQCCFQCRSATQRRFFTTFSNRSGHSNYYDLLGIKQDATMEEIKQAFFTKSKKLHPDRDPNNPNLHSQFIQLNEAYRVLSKEGSRRLYDSQWAWHATWPTAGRSPKNSPFDFTEPGPRSSASWGPDKNTRYWEQFHTHRAEAFSGAQAKQRQHWNRQLFGYCLLLMLGSMAVHYVAFRKLEEIHKRFMDNKDELITSIYNESKERARVNGFQKQQEILRQKHAEFMQRHHIRHSKDSAQK